MHDPQTKQGREKLRGVDQALTKLPRLSVGSLHFQRGPAFKNA
jgi:hypothetical protein